MAELPTPPHIKPGHLFDGGSVRLDLWRLLTSFLAEKEFSKLSEPELGDHDQPLLGLNSEFALDEITRILLSSAVALRVLDDRNGGALSQVAGGCGELQPDLAQAGQTTPLTLRGACNKILHATAIHFDCERLDGGGIAQAAGRATYLNPVMYLYGEQAGVQWRATLDIVEYVRSATRVL